MAGASPQTGARSLISEVLAECFEHCGESEARAIPWNASKPSKKKSRAFLVRSIDAPEMEPTTSDAFARIPPFSCGAAPCARSTGSSSNGRTRSWLRKVADRALVSTDCPPNPASLLQAVWSWMMRPCFSNWQNVWSLRFQRSHHLSPGRGLPLKRPLSVCSPTPRTPLKHDPDHLMTLEVLTQCFEHAGEHEARAHTPADCGSPAAPPTVPTERSTPLLRVN